MIAEHTAPAPAAGPAAIPLISVNAISPAMLQRWVNLSVTRATGVGVAPIADFSTPFASRTASALGTVARRAGHSGEQKDTENV